MEKTVFKFSEDVRRLKSKLILFSGASLFIGLTEALPQKLALIGLDFSGSQEILGWFVFWATFGFLVTFIVTSILEIIGTHIPNLSKWKTDKVTSIYGFTQEELVERLEMGDQEDGEGLSDSDQYNDIQRQKKEIIVGFEGVHQGFQYLINILLNCIAPIAFSMAGLIYLYWYMVQLQQPTEHLNSNILPTLAALIPSLVALMH